jgi:molybdenum cofactor cytidylyltransferase
MTYFAIVPAAGRSRRMGQPKLLLPWGTSTIIESVLSAWKASQVVATIVVLHPDDRQLADICRDAGAEVVIPTEPPPEMKDSIRYGLERVLEISADTDPTGWLLAPADMPALSADAIDRVIKESKAQTGKIVIPTYEQQRGHPVCFPWTLVEEAINLEPDEGVNVLRQRHPTHEFTCERKEILFDVDTPEDYRSGRQA